MQTEQQAPDILVFGRNGQLSRSFRLLLGDRAVFAGSDDADFRFPEKVKSILNQHKPKTVINCAAYTLVDKAESERDLAFQINSHTPGEIAAWCRDNESRLVHFSTDYVFNGDSRTPWSEKDPVNPLNAYGASKRSGEEAVLANNPKALIFRTSWVYSEVGQNFVTKMLELGRCRSELRVVDDQIGCPTYAPDLAEVVLRILERESDGPQASGIFHVAGQGSTNWFDFADEIFRQARNRGWDLILRDLRPIPTSEFPTPAKRPSFSVFDQSKFQSNFAVSLPDWKQSLATCMDRINAVPRA